jgi:hypothetical protein
MQRVAAQFGELQRGERGGRWTKLQRAQTTVDSFRLAETEPPGGVSGAIRRCWSRLSSWKTAAAPTSCEPVSKAQFHQWYRCVCTESVADPLDVLLGQGSPSTSKNV